MGNLRNARIPFRVSIRHNVHEENRDQVEALEAFIVQLANESGNNLQYYPSPVTGSSAAEARGEQVGLLCASDASDIGVRREANSFVKGRGHYCGAHSFWSVGIDEQGNLQKCWEAVDKPSISFGTAHDWDPANPFVTASNPDNLTKYLNTALPLSDEECRDCIWLPTCAGGCPYQRLFVSRKCIAFKDNPQDYVLALHARISENKAKGTQRDDV